MKKVFKLLIVSLLIISLVAAVAGCGKTTEPPKQSAPQPAPAAKAKIKVGSETTFPPFEMVDPKDNGKYIGFDIELIKAIGEAAGFDVEIVSLGFDGLIPAVQSGNIDMAVSAMTITDKRKEAVDFSDPYFDAGLKIAVLTKNDTIKTVDDLKGKRLGVQIGTTGAAYADDLKKKGVVKEIKTFNTIDLVFAELKKGGIDAVINDMPVTADYIKAGNADVKQVGDLLQGEQYGFAVKKGNKELLDKVNAGLKKVKESGKYQEIYNKYIGEMK